MAGSLAAREWGYNIASSAHPNCRRQMGGLEGCVAAFQLPPERPPMQVLPACEVLRRHAEGKDVNMKALLTPFSAAVISRQISSITGSVMAKQPTDAHPPCTIRSEPVRAWARSKALGKPRSKARCQRLAALSALAVTM